MASNTKLPVSPLGERIVAMIRETGPMSIAEYMHVCLNDPRHGYYPNRKAIGRKGDFITSPEVSQMFGELIGIWCLAVWQAMGKPEQFILAEAGPGNGTLMADLLRATANYPSFTQGANISLIETSPAMIQEQRAKLDRYSSNIEWQNKIEEIDDLPMILVANEFLDVLPVRQFIKTSNGWLEHCVGISDDGTLAWTTGTAMPDMQNFSESLKSVPEGSILEISPAREAWMQILSERLANNGGCALLIDYGSANTELGGTFQAVQNHKQVDPLSGPGLADLTAHVDFGALRNISIQSGVCASQVLTQGEFLQSMGLAERAGAIGAEKSRQRQSEIRSQAERLCMPEQMGNLFKVLAIISSEFAVETTNIPPFNRGDPA